jgi:hypothetical protein
MVPDLSLLLSAGTFLVQMWHHRSRTSKVDQWQCQRPNPACMFPGLHSKSPHPPNLLRCTPHLSSSGWQDCCEALSSRDIQMQHKSPSVRNNPPQCRALMRTIRAIQLVHGSGNCRLLTCRFLSGRNTLANPHLRISIRGKATCARQASQRGFLLHTRNVDKSVD